jgi:hypothetical protein
VHVRKTRRRSLTRTCVLAVVAAPYFTTTMAVGHGTPGFSTQVISIQTPQGVKVTPEQKPGAAAAPLRLPSFLCSAPPAGERVRAADAVLSRVRCATTRRAGWTLTISYRTLATPIAAGHGNTLSQVPDVITYTAQARAHH